MDHLVLNRGDSDRVIALKLYEALSDGRSSLFREQLLDVIRANVADLYAGESDDDRGVS